MLQSGKIGKSTAGSSSKRALDSDSADEGNVAKKPRKSKEKGKQVNYTSWPDYFQSLFKIYKALNTVLAFCSSRKQIASTFDSIRIAVEALLKEPLELAKVAELKALLPELIKFGYIPKNDLLIHGSSGHRSSSPDYDYSQFSSVESLSEADEHVLVLQFSEGSRGKKVAPQGSLSRPSALTSAAMRKLVDQRNQRFETAVEELLVATPANEDPVALLKAAGRDHLPVNRSWNDAEDGPKDIPSSKDRLPVTEIIDEMTKQRWYKDQIVMRKTINELEASEGTLDHPLSETIAEALQQARSITSLYSHQAEAINALHEGKHVIVSTSTASGKSVIYQVPVLRFLEEDRDATAMFIYPTKALAQDQRAAMEQLICACAGLEYLQVATYDGDTPQETRKTVRDNASVIFTNFDMLHISILPQEDIWRRFFKNLKLVAVDELHYYSDMLGSHVAQIIRRFRRICSAVGNRRVRFVSCSATISNPLKHMQTVFGVENIQTITRDGAPAGRKDFLVWKPPLKDPKDPSLGYVSSIVEATGLMRFLMKRGIRVILFCKIRKVCELAMKTVRADLSAEGRIDVLDRVMSYRGGYSPHDRRIIEHQAFSGKLLGIIATNALELGVDIGTLDAVIILGFPFGGIASLWQQAGRAGRRSRDALAVFVADAVPTDQHYASNPQELFDKPTDDLTIDLENPVIVEAHLQCAAFEMPVAFEDEQYFGPLTRKLCKERLVRDKDGWYSPHSKFMPYPAQYVSIRGVEEERYTLIDVTQINRGGSAPILEEIEVSRALFEVYEGAVFIHQGITFVINQIKHDSKVAHLVRADINWITSPRDFTDVDAMQTFRIREIKRTPESTSTEHAFYGRIQVTTTVFGYFKIRNNVILDAVDVDSVPWERETVGFWIDVPQATLDLMISKEINCAEAIHSAEHAIMNRFPMSADLHTECKAPEKEYRATESKRKRPARLIFYDTPGKSGGVAAKAFDSISGLVRSALDAIVSCKCINGCDNCATSAKCKEKSIVNSKKGAEIVLKAALGVATDPKDVSIAIHDGPVTDFVTIVPCPIVPSRVHIDIERD